MMTTAHDLTKLRSRAAAVLETEVAEPTLSARAAARCISGAVRLLGIQHGETVMRRACADLAGSDRAWSTSLLWLPHDRDHAPSTLVFVLAAVARGILPMAGVENMRAALSFWAYEDAAAWQQVAG